VKNKNMKKTYYPLITDSKKYNLIIFIITVMVVGLLSLVYPVFSIVILPFFIVGAVVILLVNRKMGSATIYTTGKYSKITS